VLELRADTRADDPRPAFDLDPYEVLRATFYDPQFPSSPGNRFPDLLVGGASGDVIVAGEFGTRAEGGDGDDVLYASAGDRLDGGAGDDVFVIGPPAPDLFWA
jgi:hypothetical protein